MSDSEREHAKLELELLNARINRQQKLQKAARGETHFNWFLLVGVVAYAANAIIPDFWQGIVKEMLLRPFLILVVVSELLYALYAAHRRINALAALVADLQAQNESKTRGK